MVSATLLQELSAPTSWEAGKDMVSEPGDTDEHLSVWRDFVPSRSEKTGNHSLNWFVSHSLNTADMATIGSINFARC